MPTPAIAVEGEGMSIDRYGEPRVFLHVCLLCLRCIQLIFNCLSLSDNVGYINGQVQPEGKTRDTTSTSKCIIKVHKQ